jgi:hypothetical protein
VAKYPDSTKSSLEYRLHARARDRWPQLTTVEVRHRGTFSYIDGVLPDATVMKLCRLRYGGSAHQWGFAIYRASHNDYEDSFFPTGTSATPPPGPDPRGTYGRDHLVRGPESVILLRGCAATGRSGL